MQSFLSRWMPIDASAHGAQLDEMNALVHWLMLVLFVGWAIYFIYVLVRFRAGANPEASYEGTKSHYSRYVEVGVLVAEAVLLVFFAIPAWARWVTPHTIDEDPVIVRVVAQQFQWNVHYPGPDGIFGPTDVYLVNDATNPLGLDRSDPDARDDVFILNRLHLPVDRPVTILLSSKDVIHSFSLPVMRVKQDAIPGMQIPVRFTPVMETPDEAMYPGCAAGKTCWEIACAQLCGITHYNMRGFFMVHSQDEFDEWMAEQVAQVTGVASEPEVADPPGSSQASGQ